MALNAWTGNVTVSNPYRHLGEYAYITCYNAGCHYSIYADQYIIYGPSWNHPTFLYCEVWYFGYHGDELTEWSENAYFNIRLKEIPVNSNPNPIQ